MENKICYICNNEISNYLIQNNEVMFSQGENDCYTKLAHIECAKDKSDFGFVNRHDKKGRSMHKGFIA